jgi:cyclopropane fatty-acyl-phospholipid synthase-like methyltransferase
MELRTGDPMGAAIYDFYKTGKAETLIVRSSMFDDDEIPVPSLFREYNQMPEIEQIALQEAKGSILDVGAGSGCHSVALQKMGKKATAIEISALSVEVMKERGVDARCVDFYDETFTEKFDTILMLMNGTGIAGNIDNMPVFLNRLKNLLNPDGCVLIDSSDLRYLYEDEDGNFEIDLADDYYGQLDYQMQYKGVVGEPFDWLYLDFNTLAYYAEENDFNAELIAEGDHYDYLARLSLHV